METEAADAEADGAVAAVEDSRPTRENLLEKAAAQEIKTFVGVVIHDGDDAAKLLSLLGNQCALSSPLASGGRLVVHFDAAKELECSQAYTTSHNPFSRRPGISKG